MSSWLNTIGIRKISLLWKFYLTSPRILYSVLQRALPFFIKTDFYSPPVTYAKFLYFFFLTLSVSHLFDHF